MREVMREEYACVMCGKPAHGRLCPECYEAGNSTTSDSREAIQQSYHHLERHAAPSANDVWDFGTLPIDQGENEALNDSYT